MKPAIQSKLRFLASVKAANPRLYHAAMQKSQGLGGLGATVEEMLAEQNAFAEPQKESWLDSAIDAVKQLAPAYVGYKQAQTCLQINAERAKQGIAPIDCGNAGLAPQVNVGVSSDVRTMGFIALGLVAVFLIMRK